MNEIFTTAVALFAGLMMTRFFKLIHLKFRDVTAFLLAGILVGPYVLGRFDGFDTVQKVEVLHDINDVALAFIAFSIGAEFRLDKIKATGKAATVIGIVQAVAATALVDLSLIALHFIFGNEVLPLPVCLTLGAIASATAPAATLLVIKQYHAEGPLTSLLLPIVALDDAVGLIVFAISFGVSEALIGGNLSVITVLINPLLEIVCSLLLGSLLGAVLAELEEFFENPGQRLALAISMVFFGLALSGVKFSFGAVTVGFSSLLVLMMLGTLFCNLSSHSEEVFFHSDEWTTPLYACFFVLSGAELDLSVFANWRIIVIGVVYVLFRMAGKYLGARLSAKAMQCPSDVVKYLGITLFPQAGVALGMSATAMALGTTEGILIRNVVLFSVLIYELIGPSLTRYSLIKAHEIQVKEK